MLSGVLPGVLPGAFARCVVPPGVCFLSLGGGGGGGNQFLVLASPRHNTVSAGQGCKEW